MRGGGSPRRAELVGEAEKDDLGAVEESAFALLGLQLWIVVPDQDLVGVGGILVEHPAQVPDVEAVGVLPHKPPRLGDGFLGRFLQGLFSIFSHNT